MTGTLERWARARIAGSTSAPMWLSSSGWMAMISGDCFSSLISKRPFIMA